MTIEKLLTPVGRIVWGHPSKAKTQTDPVTRQVKLDKMGQPQQVWSFGLAIPKAEFGQYIWPLMSQEAASAYPNGVPQGFSWKVKDGDTVDRKGIPYANREGYAGHMVLTVSTTTFAPQVFKNENGAYRVLNENEIKCGDFARLNLNMKVNVPTSPTHTPGLYINPNGVEFIAYGQEIINTGADPDDLFQGAPVAALPMGASLTPIANAATGPMAGQMPMGQPTQGFNQQPGFTNAGPAMNQQMGQQQYGVNQPQPVANALPSNNMGGGYPQPTQPVQQGPGGGYPPPAHDFHQNAGMQQPGFTNQPVNYAAQPGTPMTAPGQPGLMGQPSGGAPNAYPSNGMPGMPSQR